MKKIKARTALSFFETLQALLSAGISLTQALSLQKTQIPSLRQALTEVIRAVREGQSFSRALLTHLPLPALLGAYLRLGENSGQLAKACGLCVSSLQRQESWKRLLWQISFYPLLLTVTSLSLLGVMIGFVLPEFASLYRSLNVELPRSTAWLLQFADKLNALLIPIMLALLGIMLVILILWRQESTRIRCEILLFQLPLVKNILVLHYEFQLALQCGSLLQGGCSLIDALDFIRLGASSPLFRSYLTLTEQRIRQGETLHQSFCHGMICSPTFTALLSHAEQTGNLESVLLLLAQQHNELFLQWQERLKHVIQPCITLVMGGFLGLWILLLYYPMLQLGTNLG